MIVELPKTMCPTDEVIRRELSSIPELCYCPPPPPERHFNKLIITDTSEYDCRLNAFANMAQSKRCDDFNLLSGDCMKIERLDL